MSGGMVTAKATFDSGSVPWFVTTIWYDDSFPALIGLARDAIRSWRFAATFVPGSTDAGGLTVAFGLGFAGTGLVGVDRCGAARLVRVRLALDCSDSASPGLA